MTTALTVGLYFVVGATLCVVALVRRRAGGLTAVLVVPLWPLLAPGLFQSGGADDPLDRLVRSVRAQLGASAGDRERRAIDGLMTHLLERRRRLEAVGRASPGAPNKLRARLDTLTQQLQAELDAGRTLLEELSAQLTLVQLSGVTDSGVHATDRLHVEALVARLEAMVHEAAPPP